jgi:multisubunit Na+/H+ antiporter MnhE subunit
MSPAAGHVVRFVLFFATWVALVGTLRPGELIAGAGAALAAVVASEALLRVRLPSPFRVSRGWPFAGRAAGRILPDTARLLVAVPVRRRGRFAVLPLPPGIEWRRAGERGIAAYSASLAPGSIAAEIDPDRRELLEHRLPAKRS